MAAQQKPRVLIGERERIAIRAIPRAELPFEIRGPEIVRRGRHGPHHARMNGRPPPPPVYQAVARQEIRDCARRRPVGHAGVMPRQHRQQLAGPPERMRDALGNEEFRHRGANLVRASMRRMAPIHQPASSFGLIPGEPHEPNSPADPGPGAQRAHRVAITQRVPDKPFSLFHSDTLRPWHRQPR